MEYVQVGSVAVPKHIYEARKKEEAAERERRAKEPPAPKTEYVQVGSVAVPKHIYEVRKTKDEKEPGGREKETQLFERKQTSKGKITFNSIRQAIKKALGRGER